MKQGLLIVLFIFSSVTARAQEAGADLNGTLIQGPDLTGLRHTTSLGDLGLDIGNASVLGMIGGNQNFSLTFPLSQPSPDFSSNLLVPADGFSSIDWRVRASTDPTDCPYTPMVLSSNIDDLMDGWTSGGECFGRLQRASTAAARLSTDVAICQCLAGSNNLVAYEMNRASASQEQESQVALNVAGLTQNVQFQLQQMENFRSGLLLQTSLLVDTEEDARAIAPSFNNMTPEMGRVLGDYVSQAKRTIDSMANNRQLNIDSDTRRGMHNLVDSDFFRVPDSRAELLTSGLAADDENCVSVKEFLAFEQLPAKKEFYQALSTEEFDPDNWNITLLKQRINGVLSSRGFDSPEYKQMRERIRFLERNGLWRAIFSAPNTEGIAMSTKEELFNILKENFGADSCTDEQCRDNFMKNNYEAYRNRSQLLLGKPGVAQLINDAELQRARNLFNPERAGRIAEYPRTPTTLGAYRNWMAQFNSHLNDCDQPSRASSCLVSYSVYCPQVSEINQELRSNNPLNETDYELEALTDQELDPLKNPAYQEFRLNTCGPRHSASGSSASFATFKTNYCASHPDEDGCGADDSAMGRRALVSLYVSTYPEAGAASAAGAAAAGLEAGLHAGADAALASFLPKMNDQGNLSSREAQSTASESIRTSQINNVTNERLSRIRSRGSRFARSYREATARSSVAASSGTPTNGNTSSQSQTSSTNTIQSFSQPQLSGATTGEPVIFQPQGPSAGQPVAPSRAALASELASNSTEMQSLSGDLASLRRELQGETAKAPAEQNSDTIRGLNDQIRQMNDRLTQLTATNQRLQDQLARSDDERARAAVAAPAIVPQADGFRGGFTASSGAGVQARDAQALASTQLRPQLAPVAAPSLAPSVSGGSSGARRSGGSVNRALLASRGINPEAPAATGGAITVSQASASDYQRLSSSPGIQSASVVVPQEVFNQIASGDASSLQRLVPGCFPSGAVQVQRCGVRPEGNSQTQIEFVIQKSGDQFVATFNNGREAAAPEANRLPASAPEGGGLLDQLNQEIQNARQ